MPSPVPAALPLVRIGRQQAVSGYVAGFTQPVLVAEIEVRDPTPEELAWLELIDAAIAAFASDDDTPPPPLSQALQDHPVLARLARTALWALAQAKMPLLCEARMRTRHTGTQTVHDLILPTLQGAHAGTALALRAAADTLNPSMASSPDAGASLARLQEAARQIRAQAPTGINTHRLLVAAHDTGVPWQRIAKNVYQFGWGANARWLDSTFTDATPVIGVTLARDKGTTITTLRDAGFPVTEHRRVTSEAEALAAAQALGYPVVVKAGNLDGGQGVYAGLHSPQAVTRAYARARRLTDHLLVEKHVDGNDYRLQVFQGEVFWLTHRRPASVTGDGHHTVEALVRQVNAQRLQERQQRQSLLKSIELDEEAHDWLEAQQLTLQDVPAAGRVVRLRGAANISGGGTLEPVLDRAHPDNLALAIRAARVLRLDIAGVDLLAPDISRSWLETGGVICEVNAQPQVSPHLPAYLLSRLVQGQGRIPVVAIIGDPRPSPWFQAWQRSLAGQAPGLGLGLVLPDDTMIDATRVLPSRGAGGSPASLATRASALLRDPSVRRLLVVASDASMLSTGLPVDRMDGTILASAPSQPGPAIEALARRLAPSSRSVLWHTATRSLARQAGWPGHPGARECSSEALAAALSELLQCPAVSLPGTADAGPAAP